MIPNRFIVTTLGLVLVQWSLSWDATETGLVHARHFRRADNFLERKMREKNETFNGKYLVKKSRSNGARFLKKTLNFLKAFNCRDRSCFRIGNILVGRSNFIYANSTCGLHKAERFCILDQNMTGFDVSDRTFFFSENNKIKGFKCMLCNSVQKFHYIYNPNSHRIENVIFLNRPNRNELALKWWQAENGEQNVYIQFDLESQFLLSNIYIHFKSYPPGALVIEKSLDYGITWQPIAYYSSNCAHYFPHVPIRSSFFFEPKCTERYSKFDVRELIYRPLSGYRLMNGSDLSTHLKMTNLRFHFSELLMFGDQHMSKNKNVMMKYFYAINEIRIMGSCFCNGHASVCKQMENVEYDRYAIDRMVHSKCLCEHNTEGNNCEKCLPMFNDQAWMPANHNELNECKKCECNGHAISCHFSMEKFILTNRTSGGVCDNCMHNTQGANCEKCKDGFYHDTSVPFSAPSACKPCNCNVNGSENYQCNSSECKCKKNVIGRNCDKCKPGYWNLQGSNPEGCQKCNVEVNGTIDNKGCDNNTGVIFPCKKNVEGIRCDKCKQGFYGLSDKNEGCSPCNCSLGFSYLDPCDTITGQCKCKPNFKGQNCDQIEDGFFCPSIDYLLYEAEESIFLNNLTHINKKQNIVDTNIFWTGIGYLRCFGGAIFKFKFTSGINSAIFDVYLRYALKPGLDQIQIRITNLGPKDEHASSVSSKGCHELKPSQNQIEQKISKISIYKTNGLLISNYCLEKYHTYEIEITVFKKLKHSTYSSASEALSILIDSIILIPNFDVIKNQIGLKNEEFKLALNCKEKYLDLPRAKSDRCDKLVCLMTSNVIGLLPCQCNGYGSDNIKCEFFGGQCNCKPHVIGRQCDKCDSVSWGFSDRGCLPCNCDPFGSISNQCDLIDGQCQCKENNYGKSCKDCRKGYFDPPNCRKCECYGFSNECQSDGQCLNCMENTEGKNCERCKIGFYGSPKDRIGCKACNCPGVNGNNFANSCNYDFTNKTLSCYCQEGYTGPRCDKCDKFYFGNPLDMNGECKKCNCNGNIDETNAEICDRNSGKCLNCLYNTDGFNCDKCQNGYYGNALNHDCKPCQCNPLGIVKNTSCNSEFGFCECLPKVIGKNCDECAQNFWNLESGAGCIECDCDTTGTLFNSTQCDQKTGQCQCVSERSGRRCDQCPFGQWGNPLTECKKCQCSSEGSVSQQCDKVTGQCECISGVVGYHCDQCDRGTTGSAPFCKKCGECFDKWDKTIFSFNSYLEKLEKKSFDFTMSRNKTNLTSFQSEYEKMSQKLDDLNKALSFNTSDIKIKKINSSLNILKSKIEKYTIFAQNQSEIFALNSSYNFLFDNYQAKRALVDSHLRQAIDFRESFFKGAIESIQISEIISEQSFNQSRQLYLQFEPFVLSKLEFFDHFLTKNAKNYHKFIENSKNLKNTSEIMLRKIEANISSLNKVICGSSSNNCSDQCGGIECENCGIGCESFANTYLEYKNLKDTINQSYAIKIHKFKDILTQANLDRHGYKSFYDDLASIKTSLDNDLNQYEYKKMFIKNFIKEMFDLSDRYQSNIQKIHNSTDLIIQFDYSISEDDFNSIIQKLNEKESNLKKESKLDKVNHDLDRYKKLDIFKLSISDKIAKLVENKNKELNETALSLEETGKKLLSRKNFIHYEEEIQSKINMTLESLKLKLSTVRNEISHVMDARRAFKKDINGTEVKIEIKTGSKNLILVKKKIQEIEKKFKTLIEKLKLSTTDKILFHCFKLMDKIMTKSSEIGHKYEKIEKLKILNLKLEGKISRDKSKINFLKESVLAIRQRFTVDKFGKILCQ